MAAMHEEELPDEIECGALNSPAPWLRPTCCGLCTPSSNRPVTFRLLRRAHAANCGTTQNLLKCSRCHTAWFCGVKCQKVGEVESLSRCVFAGTPDELPANCCRRTGPSTALNASATSLRMPLKSRSPSLRGGCESTGSRPCSRMMRSTAWSAPLRLLAGQAERSGWGRRPHLAPAGSSCWGRLQGWQSCHPAS